MSEGDVVEACEVLPGVLADLDEMRMVIGIEVLAIQGSETMNGSTLTVVYHQEDASWWAESSDLPGFSAVGSTLDEVSQLLREALKIMQREQSDRRDG